MKKYLAVLAAVLTALFVAGCSSDSDTAGESSSAASEEHNTQDVMFAQMMIPHHQQAIEMADMVPARGASPELEALAEQIKDAQQPEIDEMTGWLESWDQNVPDPDSSMGDHAGHAGMGGMMTDEQMTALEAASGPEFEKMWLEMMIQHHAGAVQMAEEQKEYGQYEPAMEMADEIIKSQQAEIDQMEEMLAS